ncbi:ABC transporter permease [Candidatus Bathyarchaeota archaeon]|nr:ABC transporter permease [Candidatus Bathyarchaeota archaeon]
MANMFTVASKEFSDIVRGKRFLILVIVFGLMMTVAIASIYLRVIQAAQQAGGVAMPRGFLGLAAYNLITTMSYFAPILGLALGCDAISGEREKGTLKTTLVQPVFRDTIINGKFSGAFLSISLAIVIASLVGIVGSVLTLGITPTGEDVTRLFLFMLFSILFAMTYYGLAAFLSTVSKRTTQSVIISVMLWAVFTFVIPIVASLVAVSTISVSIRPFQNATRPFKNATSRQELQRYVEELRRQSAITESIQSIAPNYHFTRIAQYILQAYAGGIGARIGIGGAGQGLEGLRAASILQSLSFAWPNILVLTISTILTFIASYMVFTRQEIR